MSKKNIEAVYPLSPMQQGMLFHSLYAPESGVYVEQMTCIFGGDLDVPAFERAWQQAAERHPILRTAFVWKSLEKTFQVVHREVNLSLEQQDWRGLAPPEQAAQLEAFLQTDHCRGFDVSKAPLMRLALMRTAGNCWQFVWTHHHALLDGWSVPLLLKEVLASYEAYRGGQGQTVRLESPRPYRDYIAWLQKQDFSEAEAFWRRTLKGFAAPTPLVVDRPAAGAANEVGYAELETQLSAEATTALQSLARQHQLTMNTLVQGAWALLLSYYCGEEDIVFGATVSGRPADLPGAESILGLFINTLPVRVRVPPDAMLLPWLKELQAQQVELRHAAREHSPLVQIQGWSDVPRGLPMFESILVFENYPTDALLQQMAKSLRIRDVRSIEQTNYPLTVVSGPGQELVLKMSYDGRRFDADTIRRMLGHLRTLLEGFASDPNQCLSTLPLLTEPERYQLLVEWNNTTAEYPRDRYAQSANLCIHQLFEEQVERTPDAEAVVFEGQALTYRELNRQANQLAHYMQKQGIGPEALVGLYVERSLETIVGMLGILKAGGAYVPLDPTYPADRITFMLEDTQAPVLLTQSHLLTTLSFAQSAQPSSLKIVCLDADWGVIAQESDANLTSGVTADNLAYVIYTSGSTGKPKGTLLQHRGLCNFAHAYVQALQVGVSSRVLQFASISFDASVSEIFPALLSGARLVLASRETLLSMPDLARLVREQAITHAVLPPSVLGLLTAEELPTLKTLVSAGESCPGQLAARWAVDRRLFNGYGPTEATVGPTLYRVEPPVEEMANIPIGRPLPNVQGYVLNSHLRPVPIGVPGELYLSGICLARGYLNRPELTTEKFIPAPRHLLALTGEEREGDRSPGKDRVLYKTGDLVRYRPDGNLEFLGRLDHQVKIRGFRVELGEIEAALGQLPAVREAVVLCVERNAEQSDKRLVAYIVASDGGILGGTKDKEPFVSELRAFLKRQMPEYMLPSVFVTMDALPRLPNGKVDRRTLAGLSQMPGLAQPDLESDHVAPRTPTEEILAGIWARVLGVERTGQLTVGRQPAVGIHDSFFELGGHSLLATQLISRVREAFHIELPIRGLFEQPTVAEQARQIEMAQREAVGLAAPPIQPVSRDANTDLPLSFAQQRLWFLDQLEPGNLFYNIPMAVRLTGTLDVQALRYGLNEIVRRHEVLRTKFAAIDGRPVQVIAPELIIPLPVTDLRHLSASEREAEALRLATKEARQPFDLSHGPLLRAQLLRLDEQEHIALLTIHHIASDGWSMGILIRELATLYQAFSMQQQSPLAELPIQYADFSSWQREWLRGEVLENQLAYWKKQLAGSPPILELPTDRPRPAVQTSRGAQLSFALPKTLSDAVKALSRQEGVTLFMTLLAAFQTLLHRYSGQDDICVGTPIANRTRAEIENLIGFFVNTLVMRADLSGNLSFRDLLKQVREVALGAYAHQDLPFEMLVETLQPQRDLSHTPLFQVMFVLDNAPRQAVGLPGLTINPLQVEAGRATFDLTLSLMDRPEGFVGYIEYNTDLFDVATIERMLGHYQVLLEGVVADSGADQPVSTLPMLTRAEWDQVLIAWNKTEVEFPNEHCIHWLFEEQVEQRPEALAVTFEKKTLTYRELNSLANRLAHYLRKLSVGPDVLVGISTERSMEMVVGILGILKAGGAYLPLDPTYPADRLAFMLQDSAQAEFGMPVLLTQAHLIERLPAHEAQVVRLDVDWETIAKESDENLVGGATAENLAYVIYTSGSTGKPKGTMLQHRGLCNLASWQQRAFGITEGSRVLQFSPLSFDASVWEMFMALRNGGTLCLARQETLASGPDLVKLMQAQGITTATLPPSVLAALDAPPDGLPALRTIIAAGEACPADLVTRWGRGRQFFNAYGPTETTVCASMALCDPDDAREPSIGRPIANTQLHILDKNLQAVPVGVPGELHVGGAGLARGYLNRPELTAGKFILNPFGNESVARSPSGDLRLYKTGDLVRYRPDGDVEFLGRIDQQVKVRGFRIELGEIEAVLRQHEAVQDAVVVAREDIPGDKRLVAYIVQTQAPGPSTQDARPSSFVSELRAHLRQHLPEYMVPSAFVMLEALPLSPSGKVDRKALPAPEGTRPEMGREYVAPRTASEEKLAAMCAELLGVDRVGVYDSFFELGGHSLLATQFISRVREAFHVELPLRSLFEGPTVAELAAKIGQAGQAQQDMDKIARMLMRVQQLDESEVRALLEEKQSMIG